MYTLDHIVNNSIIHGKSEVAVGLCNGTGKLVYDGVVVRYTSYTAAPAYDDVGIATWDVLSYPVIVDIDTSLLKFFQQEFLNTKQGEKNNQNQHQNQLRIKLEKEFNLEGHLMAGAGLFWELAWEKGLGNPEQVRYEYGLLAKLL